MLILKNKSGNDDFGALRLSPNAPYNFCTHPTEMDSLFIGNSLTSMIALQVPANETSWRSNRLTPLIAHGFPLG